jgi:hypothetical protein
LFAITEGFAGKILTSLSVVAYDYADVADRDQSLGLFLNRCEPAIDKEAYRDPRLFALNLLGEQLSKSAQPLVPERVLLFGQS